jgi:hypothetical protein
MMVVMSSKSTCPLSILLSYNNEGVQLLLKKRAAEALPLFFRSLVAIQDHIQRVETEKLESNNESNAKSIHFIHAITNTLPGFHDRSVHFTFCEAFAFPEDVEPIAFQKESTAFLATISLNTALCYHQSGLIEGCSSALEKAQAMYALVDRILSSHNLACNGTALLVKSAATNNLSQLKHDHGDFAFTNDGFRRLEYLLCHFNYILDHNKCRMDVYMGMLSNVLCVGLPSAAPIA